MKIGCYHAHYSNIEHIEKALASYEVELIHFVDPGIDQMKNNVDFDHTAAENKVIATLDWIAKCHVDAILITCTFFTAVFNEELHPYPVPIIKIDRPLFNDVCQTDEGKIFVFTNPSTVKGTMEQFHAYTSMTRKEIPTEAKILANTFELIMAGKKEEYLSAVAKGLSEIAMDNPGKKVIAAQLSMVPAALQAERELDIAIANPLHSLAGHMEQMLSLQSKSK
jgi:hypothetical protein